MTSSAETPLTSSLVKPVILVSTSSLSVPISGITTAVFEKTPTYAATQSKSVVTPAIHASETVNTPRVLRNRPLESVSSASIPTTSGTTAGVETAGGDTTRPTKKARPPPVANAAEHILPHSAVAFNSAVPLNLVPAAPVITTITTQSVPNTPAVLHNDPALLETIHTGNVSPHISAVSSNSVNLAVPLFPELTALPVSVVNGTNTEMRQKLVLIFLCITF